MLGRARPAEPAEDRLVRLTAQVDQALALADQTMRKNSGNRDLVDVCLDFKNLLGKGHTR